MKKHITFLLTQLEEDNKLKIKSTELNCQSDIWNLEHAFGANTEVYKVEHFTSDTRPNAVVSVEILGSSGYFLVDIVGPS